MSDISNKTLAILVGVAIVVSLLGILSIGKGGVTYMTGRGSSGAGPVSFNATSEVSIKVAGSIDWGNGRVNATSTSATLDSNAGTVTGGSWTPITQYITVENDGTVNISVDVNANGDNNANGLIGGTSPGFQMKGVATESSSCVTLATDYTSVPNSTETPFAICDILQYANNADTFNVAAKVVIPSDAATGARNATITFSATEV